jgi:hypothetical protein
MASFSGFANNEKWVAGEECEKTMQSVFMQKAHVNSAIWKISITDACLRQQKNDLQHTQTWKDTAKIISRGIKLWRPKVRYAKDPILDEMTSASTDEALARACPNYAQMLELAKETARLTDETVIRACYLQH